MRERGREGERERGRVRERGREGERQGGREETKPCLQERPVVVSVWNGDCEV